MQSGGCGIQVPRLHITPGDLCIDRGEAHPEAPSPLNTSLPIGVHEGGAVCVPGGGGDW